MMKINDFNLYLNYDSCIKKLINFACAICLCPISKIEKETLNGSLTN